MNETQPYTPDIEQRLSIHFVRPDQAKLNELYVQLEQVAQHLDTDLRLPSPPQKGFLAESLALNQEKIVLEELGPVYANAAVELQEKLTSIAIEENNERMVYLPTVFQQAGAEITLSELPFHEACGEWAGKPRVFWVRESVATRVLQAGQALAAVDVVLHLEDAFRPVGVQEGLFHRRIKMILHQHPEWAGDWEKVWTEAKSKTAVSPWMAGHKSGAAVDITLRTAEGAPLPLGNKYPEGGPKVAIHYPYLTQEQWATCQLFLQTMEMSGLRTYPYENWHASFGDLSAGIAAFSATEVTPDYKAVYGPIKRFDPVNGDIEPYQIEEYYQPFFTQEELLQ